VRFQRGDQDVVDSSTIEGENPDRASAAEAGAAELMANVYRNNAVTRQFDD
jgi:hypothetical protein